MIAQTKILCFANLVALDTSRLVDTKGLHNNLRVKECYVRRELTEDGSDKHKIRKRNGCQIKLSCKRPCMQCCRGVLAKHFHNKAQWPAAEKIKTIPALEWFDCHCHVHAYKNIMYLITFKIFIIGKYSSWTYQLLKFVQMAA